MNPPAPFGKSSPGAADSFTFVVENLLQVAMPYGAVITPVSQPVLLFIERVHPAYRRSRSAPPPGGASARQKTASAGLIEFPFSFLTPAQRIQVSIRKLSRLCQQIL